MNYPKITKIIKAEKENSEVKTLFFKYPEKTISGQFFMIWIPGIDEVPMSASYISKDIKGTTFRIVGDSTKALFKLKVGDQIGVRGPYGNGFRINGKNILFVGGGTGIATIAPSVEDAKNNRVSSTVILGVKNKNELFFVDRIKKCGATVHISTDDGSKGQRGFASDFARRLLLKNKYDSIITCGPELMMKKLFEMCRNIPFQASLERYMKCGIGICGQCTMGKGLRVCKEGPVFDGEMLKNIEDFGIFKRDASGRKVRF